MKIFITGGTGLIGGYLCRRLLDMGHELTVLSRSVQNKKQNGTKAISFLQGDPAQKGPWQDAISKHEIIINLAGSPIFCLWSKANKQEIYNSRIKTTKNIVAAIGNDNNKVSLLISGSAVGYYGFHGDEELDESANHSHDFLATVCKDWEEAALLAENKGVRVAICRTGVVLTEKGGALGKMLPAFRLGLGSPLGSGRQWFSWIHISDLIKIIIFILEHKEISGPVNCTAPKPVTNRDFSRILAQVLKRPFILPALPGFLIKILLGEFGSFLLAGQKVLPAKLDKNGFEFKLPNLHKALTDLLIS